jgi:hypothetical protein
MKANRKAPPAKRPPRGGPQAARVAPQASQGENAAHKRAARRKAIEPATRRGPALTFGGSRKEDLAFRGALWAGRIAKLAREFDELRLAELGLNNAQPNPKRLDELRNIFAKLTSKIDDTEIDRFWRRENARVDVFATVEAAEKALRECQRLLLDGKQAKYLKAQLPKEPTNGYTGNLKLIAIVIEKATELDSACRLDQRCPIRETAVAVAAKFLDLPENRIRRFLAR